VAPYYGVTINTLDEANAIFNSKAYQRHKDEVYEIAKAAGLKVVEIKDGVGGFEFQDGNKIKEATSAVTITGAWNDMVKFAAMYGALAPEVQEATIAAMYVAKNSLNHNGDEFTYKVDNNTAAMQAAVDAGFDSAGFTLLDGQIKFLDIFEYSDGSISKMLLRFVEIQKYGGE